MKPIIALMIAVAAIIMLALNCKKHVISSSAKKAQQPVKHTGEKGENDYLLHRISMRLNLF